MEKTRYCRNCKWYDPEGLVPVCGHPDTGDLVTGAARGADIVRRRDPWSPCGPDGKLYEPLLMAPPC